MRPLFVPLKLVRFSGRVDMTAQCLFREPPLKFSESSCRCGATTAFSFSYNSTYTAVGLGKDDHRVISLPPRGLVFSSGMKKAKIVALLPLFSLKRPISGGLRLITTRTDRRSMKPHIDFLKHGTLIGYGSKWTVVVVAGSKNGTAIEYYADRSINKSHTWTASHRGRRRIKEVWVETKVDKQHGTVNRYYPDGSKSMEIPYVDGQLHGTKIEWHYKTESKAQETPFVNGKNHGTAISYFYLWHVEKRHGKMIYYWSHRRREKSSTKTANSICVPPDRRSLSSPT